MNRFVAFAMIMTPILFLNWVLMGMSGLIGGVCGLSIFTGFCYLKDKEWPWE